MNYDELYKKYMILEEENKRLQEELQQLRVKLVSEKAEAYCTDIDLLTKEDILEQTDTLITYNSPSNRYR